MVESIHPNLLALIAAVLVAMAHTLYRKSLLRLSPTVTTLVMNLSSLVYAAGLYFLEGGVDEWPLEGLFWFALIGIAGGSLGRYLNFLSVNLLGLARTSVLIQSVLIWSTALGVFILGERMTFGIGLGTLAIMFGAIMLVYEGDAKKEKVPMAYYLISLLTSFLFSLTFLFRIYGLNLIPSPPLGLSVSSLMASLILIGAMPFSGTRRGRPREWETPAVLTVVIGASFNLAAAYFFWTAFKRGAVVQLVPINRLSVLLIIFFSWLFFRKQEAVTFQVVLGGLLSVAGAFAIVAGK